MQRTVGCLALCDMFFILFLALSGSVSGVGGRIIYYLAYVLPIAAMIFLFRGNMRALRIAPRRDSAELTLLSLFPFIGIIILISYLTSSLLGLFGAVNETDVSGNVFYELARHALAPAILEELLFRFIPISLLAPYSKKNAVFISSLLFAFAHCNFFQIPYALVAGFVLGTLTLATGSIIPSVVLHFLNNALSVIMLKYAPPPRVMLVFYIVLAALALLSVTVFVLRRSRYLGKLKESLTGEERLSLPSGAVIFIVMTSIIGVINFVGLL